MWLFSMKTPRATIAKNGSHYVVGCTIFLFFGFILVIFLLQHEVILNKGSPRDIARDSHSRSIFNKHIACAVCRGMDLG